MKRNLRLILSTLLLLVVFLSGCSARQSASSSNKEVANDYPKRQIELVVPFAAGGGVDLAARAVADALSKEWKQPIIVTDKPGGGGIVGARYALKEAKADGYTVLVNNNSTATMYEAGTTQPTITNKDNKFAARVAQGTLAYAVKSDAKWSNFKEFSAWVKAHPEKLTWTSVGPAGFSAFGVAEWLRSIGVNYKQTTMVSSDGASDSAAKVAGGHVILAVHTVGEFAPLVQSGKIKLLAVQSSKRNAIFPKVPTTLEQGFKNLTVKWWTGLSFPAGTPDAIVQKWSKAIGKLEKNKSFLNKIAKIKLEPGYLNATDFSKDVKEETDRLTKLAEDTGIRK
ncbi:MAG: tripartite tricarboxylate transporter substrate binding protein [Sporolactobacillus sp.]|jgi:tripartite-type tricarboxylate transporter receptor subunit TctC|nr:tripartite tricarboxylate transporter substrate binding protein [Sporolactobacillus sp.]